MKKSLYFILSLIIMLLGNQEVGAEESSTEKYINASTLEEFFDVSSELISNYWDNRYFDELLIDTQAQKLLVDSEVVKDDVHSYYQKKKLMLPLGMILDSMGAQIKINKDKVEIEDIGIELSFDVEEDKMSTVNEMYDVKLDNTRSNEIFVELEFFEEELGLVIEEDDNSIIIIRPYQTMRLIVKASRDGFKDLNASCIIKGPDNLYVLQFDSIKDTMRALDYLTKQNWVDYAEPDYYIVNQGVEKVGELINKASTYPWSWGVKHLEADKYRSYLLEQNFMNSVTVAVVDSGIDFNHSFLKGRILSNGYDYVNNDYYPYDDHGHGTHVAGTIVDMTQGLNIKILPIKVLSYSGNGTSLNAGNGIKYAVSNGAEVINFSIYMYSHSQYIDNVILDAINQGVTVVICAGNFNKDTATQCPSHLTEAIIVAAIDSRNRKAPFSNYGQSIDVAAPGVSVISAYPGGGYVSMDGTSMATPHIAAIAAMYKLENPNLSPAEIEELVKLNTEDIGDSGWDKYFGHGVPKLSKAFSIPLQKIELNQSQISLYEGESTQLTVAYYPSDTTIEKNVVWNTSDETVVSVNNGTVTALKPGKAIVMATVGESSVSCEINVLENSIVYFPDRNLKRVINNTLGYLSDHEIKRSELNNLKTLYASYNEIVDLEGLQHATNLENLNLAYNNIQNIEVLNHTIFDNLQTLILDHNKIEDISVLGNREFNRLTNLKLNYNCIKDMTPLLSSKFPRLNVLYLYDQQISLDEQKILRGQTLEVVNPIVSLESQSTMDFDIYNGIYDERLRKFIWNSIEYSDTLTFTFSQNVTLGGKMATFSGTGYVPVVVTEAPVIMASNQVLRVFEPFDPLYSVYATDLEDGDLTAELNIIYNSVDTSQVGVYEVTYEVSDSDGNLVRKTIEVTVRSNEVPVISGAESLEILEGTSFDRLENVKAIDKEDGDITKLIKVEGKVDTDKPGKYEITYRVMDSDGNETVVIREITVLVAQTVLNQAPVIKGVKDYTIKVGDYLDLTLGVTAYDEEDGDLTDKLEIQSDLDTTKIGSYGVTYSVTDSQGAKTTKSIIVTVESNGVPVISGVGDLEIEVKTSFDPLESITASDLEDGDLTSQIVVTGSVDVSQLGEYSLTYAVTDRDGNQTIVNRLVTVVDRLAPVIVLNGESHIKLEMGQVYHELGATATDNVDNQVEIEILGTVNVNQIGSYTITYRATDQSGNQSELMRVIEVVGKEVLFPDVELGKWYTTHIQEFASLGYIKGYSDGMFKPQNSITRAEFVKIVNKAFGLAGKFTPVTDLPFTDLDSQWKKDELKLALAAGYITPATEFRHNAPINRQEAAKIIGYLLGDKLSIDSDWKFADSNEIATWAKAYVTRLVEVGVLSQNENFRPQDSITRAEAVKMLNIARTLN